MPSPSRHRDPSPERDPDQFHYSTSVYTPGSVSRDPDSDSDSDDDDDGGFVYRPGHYYAQEGSGSGSGSGSVLPRSYNYEIHAYDYDDDDEEDDDDDDTIHIPTHNPNPNPNPNSNLSPSLNYDSHDRNNHEEPTFPVSDPYVPLRSQPSGLEWPQGLVPREEDVVNAREQHANTIRALAANEDADEDLLPGLPVGERVKGGRKERPDRETRRQRRRERLAAFFRKKGRGTQEELLSGDALAKLLGSKAGEEDWFGNEDGGGG
ncbi:hypothetical protein BO70DRAFT_430501 [Aspergillus heteromorphus CBS 117.55]|uniref:Uncharacterized protein n=1 Tax=Aspergillus heteromorphus CBS 117.55 TaxID=1448321 RepID=A0A317VYK3_9EURO|nr:uncharacterized protein BO70DRAFT_430501 [Aspergillus heteromorphus CBS 117.55]PWY76970.1 hypothetical protein BO70DRAFT_430501 [Aspergillus heteromorphus CBS 117.55]